MNRRNYIAIAGSSLTLLAGCTTGEESTDGETSTTATDSPGTESVTETPTDTPTPEPDPKATITDAGLLRERERYTDLARDIGSVGLGGEVIVGLEYELPVKDGAVSAIIQATVYDDDDTELDRSSMDSDAVVQDGSAFVSHEGWFAFDTSDWHTGRYTIELVINATEYGTTADPVTVEFDIVEPLGESDVALELVEKPNTIRVNEPFDLTYNIRNVSDRDSSLTVDAVVVDHEEVDAVELERDLSGNIPAGGREQFSEVDFSTNVTGEFTYRIPELGVGFPFTVEPPRD
ncbi:hypothetical protein AMS69_04785 [Haloarcula rubripromontorii]|uniref:Uncharacterized protein n=1 Tax=Haloarcula rubripromontorii TaxID=1705562 RepID=A0A0N0BQB4_9EURY|nr:hypothetical protein [Haloarcula rubripromontorii]KOX95170.1 hypothetical protein AMS69_04785 [Haloarcula rubripromontorii]NLV04836.1 hypothetical protein [Haloarcula rubripromontorii]